MESLKDRITRLERWREKVETPWHIRLLEALLEFFKTPNY